MKLKILPPTLRNKKRYIAFEAISTAPLTRDDVISMVWDSSLNYYGELRTSKFNLWIMKIWNFKSSDEMNITKGIIQCNREETESVRTSILLINKFKGRPVAFHTLGISGTIKAAIKKYIKLEVKHK